PLRFPLSPRMGVVSWLVLVALVAYLIPTVSCVDPVTLIVYSNVDDDSLKGVVLNVSEVVRDKGMNSYGFLGVGKADDCFVSLR
ncbi:hypothetical protein PMAYCL1PPCAC_13277, partial [Pristionchus mayeri]